MNMNIQKLYHQGQSIWLDNITRKMLNEGILQTYISEYGITGLTSNPTIFDKAIAGSEDYNNDINSLSQSDLSDEELFFHLAIKDIQKAADLFLPVFERTGGLDGFVSIEVSPLLAYDKENTVKAARDIYNKVDRPNAFIKIPGTPEGLLAIEKAIAEGIPVNVTLLFSAEQYEAAANAYLNGIETRINNGLDPDIRSVASVFVSRWDKAVAEIVPDELINRLGIAVTQKTYKAYNEFLNSDRVRKIMNYGIFPQRLLWASTGTKDPAISDIFYVTELAAPYTVNTMPENTMLAFADHGEADNLMLNKTGEADNIIKKFARYSVDYLTLANQLQTEGAESFSESWKHLIETIKSKRI